jgi:hypothetical protein
MLERTRDPPVGTRRLHYRQIARNQSQRLFFRHRDPKLMVIVVTRGYYSSENARSEVAD